MPKNKKGWIPAPVGDKLRRDKRVDGQMISYGQLSKMAGRANAARAVGGILGANRLPLIIPCHRVIRGDGGMGGFSAEGGVEFKKKMLELERKGGQRIEHTLCLAKPNCFKTLINMRFFV